MPRKRDQRKERRCLIYRDQHGRSWEVTYDMQGLGTTGGKTPYKWTAPVLPPDAYFLEFEDRPLLFEIDYPRWISDLEQRGQEYRNERTMLARNMDKDEDSLAVRNALGKAPYPADLAKACRAGNKWALGLTPNWREKFPPWALAYKQDYWGPEGSQEVTFEDVDGGYEDVEPEPLPDEKYGSFEEQHDPEGVGGVRQKTVKTAGAKRRDEQRAMASTDAG